jgi:outer membrane protein
MSPKKLFLLLIILATSFSMRAQQVWDLKSCVEYAMANNISVKLSDVQAKVTAETYRQSKMARWPDVSFNGSSSVNSGTNQTGSFERVTQTFISTGMQLQTSADIFNFYSKRNTIAGNEWEAMAAKANVDKLREDIALTVANAYLQILLAQEQEKIALVQVQQTSAQLSTTQKMVEAGSLPELNASQLEAQLALDSVNYISAKGQVTLNILILKSYMNVDAAAPFEIVAPPLEKIPVEPIADLQPESVYTLAIANLPQQRVNEFKLKAAEKFKAASKGLMYPTLSAFGALSSSYNVFEKTAIYEPIFTGNFEQTGLVADAGGGTFYEVKSPVLTQGAFRGYIRSDAFGTQFIDNLREAIGINVNVPIFSGGRLRSNYEKSKLNILSLQLQKDLDNQKLKQDIYQAYNAAIIALEKFNASGRTVEMNEKTYDFAGKRFNVGMLSTFDLITTQNNLFRARLEYAINQFDYVFKLKVLEFYKGQGLKL